MTPRKRRRLLRFGVIILALAFAGWLGLSYALAPFLRHRLQEMVGTYLNADLRIGHLRYHFPYGVTVTDAALVTHGPDGQPVELIKAASIDLRLAELPHHDKPLVIQRLIFRDPQVNLIRMPQGGIVGEQGLLKPDALKHKETNKRLSDMFRLRRFALTGGKVVYEDRTRPDLPPCVWNDLHIDLNTDFDAHNPALYKYRLLAEHPPIAFIGSQGSFDIDDLHLLADQFKVEVTASPDGSGSDKIPGVVQQFLKDNAIRGKLTIEGNARLFFRDPTANQLDAKVALADAAAYIPRWDVHLDDVALQLRVSTTRLAADDAATQPVGGPTTSPATKPTYPPLFVQIDSIKAGSHDTHLTLRKGAIEIDPDARTWRARKVLATVDLGQSYAALPSQMQRLLAQIRASGKLDLTLAASGPWQPPPGTRAVDAFDYEAIAVPRDFTFQPPHFVQPLDHVSGTVYAKPNLLRFENVSAHYGSDRLFLATARVPLDELPEKVRFQEIAGSVDFAGHDEPYPLPLRTIFDNLHPKGTLHAAGAVTVRPKSAAKTEYALDLSTDHAAIAPEPKRLPFTDLHCDLKLRGVSNGDCVTDVVDARATAFTGTVTAKGQLVSSVIAPGRRLLTYRGTGHVAEVNVEQLAAAWSPTGHAPAKASGKLYLDAQFAGTGKAPDGKTALDALRAAGEFEILEGNFWQIPVIADVTKSTNPKLDPATVGQAAAMFQLADRKLELTNAAISAPVLGLQGNGRINLADDSLDLRVIAAPLADWRDKLKSTNVPIVSDALGAAAGGIQKLLNTATRTLLYEFRITGTISKPTLTTVPAPILTDGSARLFGSMLSPGKDDRLLDHLRPKPKP